MTTTMKPYPIGELLETPIAVADHMVELLYEGTNRRGLTVLEPSAGRGRLYRAVRNLRTRDHITLVESNPTYCARLYAVCEGDDLVRLCQGDFLTRSDLGTFDRIIMSPPFEMPCWEHVLRAKSMLNRNGRMVSLCHYKENDYATIERNLMPIATSWQKLKPHLGVQAALFIVNT